MGYRQLFCCKMVSMTKMGFMTAHDLRAWREQRGMSQRDLATKLQVSGSTLSRWENGEQEIPGPALLLLELLIEGKMPFEVSAAAGLGNVVREDIGDVSMTVDAFEECLRRSREAGFASVTEWIAHLVREELGADPKAIPERREVRYGNAERSNAQVRAH